MATVITHRVDGDGEPLILLNGGLMTISSWEVVMPELVSDYKVVRCDFRGQLLSPGKPPPTLGGHVDDLVDLLDQLGINETHVFGASFGGEVGLLLAARHPARVRSLVVLTSTDLITEEMRESSRELVRLADAAARGGDGGEVFRAIAKSTFSDRWLAIQDPDYLDQRAAQVARLPASYFEALSVLVSALGELDLASELSRIHAPTLIIGAELDQVFPLERSRALARAIDGAELRVIMGSGHGAIVEATDEVLSEVRGFLSRPREVS